MPMKNIQPTKNKFDEKLFQRILRMAEGSQSLIQLEVCRKYFLQFKEWYDTSPDTETKFKSKFEQRKLELLNEQIKEEQHNENVKRM